MDIIAKLSQEHSVNAREQSPFPCFSPRAHDTHNRRLLNTFIYFAFAMTDVASRTTDPRSSIDRWEVEELVSEVITRLYSAPDRGPASSARLPPCLTSALARGEGRGG